MKKILFVSFLFVTGCGMTFESTRLEDGRPIATTYEDIGYASVETKTEYNDPLMETCLAKVGKLPLVANEEGQTYDPAIAWCLEDTKRGLDRDNRQLDYGVLRGAYGGFYSP